MVPVPTPEAVASWCRRPGLTWLFKHSRTCPVSAAAHAEVASFERAHPRDAVGLVVVQDNREASGRVEEVLGVLHQSPQIFLIRDGRVEWHASHGAITLEAMETRRVPGP